MAKRIAFLLVIVAGLPLAASAATETWVQVKSPHFVVLTDSSEKQARHVAAQFERMRAVFHAAFPKAQVDSGAPILVIAVKDKKGMQALEPEAYLAKGQIELAGLFLRTQDKNYVLMRLDAQGSHPYATIYHEYTHFLLSGTAGWMPLWMNEGMAEFFQNTEIHDKDAELGQPSADDILFLRQNRLIPLKVLFAVDQKSPYYHEEQKGSIFYAESWALIHMLQMADHMMHTQALRIYAEEVSQHVDPVTAGERAFGDLVQLQKALEMYISRLSFQEFRIDVPNEVNESSFTATPMTPAAANAVRADFLAYNDRSKDARALLDSVLQEDPKNGQAHETMGYLEFRAGNLEAARKWYEQAVELDSHSYLAHYYYASLSMTSGRMEHPEQMEASLRTAIELNPGFAPACDRLATFYGMRHEKLSEAQMLSLRATQLDPANIGYRLNTANVLQEEDRPKDALSVLKAALALAKSPEDTAMLEGRIQQLQQYQAQKDQYEEANRKAAAKATVASTTAVAFPAPTHPTEEPHGTKLLAKGVIQGVQCSEPAVIELTVTGGGKNFSLYSNNYYSIGFSAANFTPDGDIHPCTDLQGMKASVKYSATSDKSVDGQIFSIELSK
jgi:tetratricopeptide (TPR) repeat protein